MIITACLIIKNEEKYLANCLSSIERLCSEIIIVDTGSTDTSIEIAKAYTSKIFHYTWENDYAAARNESLKHATGDFILYIDADEELESNQEFEIKSLLKHNNYDALILNVKSYMQSSENENIIRYPRIFRNYKNLSFKYAIHEQIIDSLDENDARFYESDVNILHHGYNIPLQDLIKKKERNLLAIESILKNEPSNEYYRYHLGMSLFSLERYEEAIRELNLLLSNEYYGNSEIYNVIALSYSNLNYYKESTEFCQKSIEKSANQFTAWYLLGDNLLAEKKYDDSIQAFERYLQIEDSTLSSDFRAAKSLVHEKMGLAYLMVQQVRESNKHLKKALEHGPINEEHITLINKYLAITEKYI